MSAATATYIVIFVRDQWWIDLNGQSQGPFISRDSALSEAIRFASDLARDGKRSEVRVADPGKKTQVVFQSADQSLLGRGAVVVHH